MNGSRWWDGLLRVSVKMPVVPDLESCGLEYDMSYQSWLSRLSRRNEEVATGPGRMRDV